MLGSPMGLGMASKLHPDVLRGQGKIEMTNITMPNNSCSMKYALKLVPGLADVGVLHVRAPKCPGLFMSHPYPLD